MAHPGRLALGESLKQGVKSSRPIGLHEAFSQTMAYGALSIFEAREERARGEGDIEHDLPIHRENGGQDGSQ